MGKVQALVRSVMHRRMIGGSPFALNTAYAAVDRGDDRDHFAIVMDTVLPHARSHPVLPTLVGQGTFASGGRVIEIEPVEFILAGRCDREIRIGRPIGRRQDFP